MDGRRGGWGTAWQAGQIGTSIFKQLMNILKQIFTEIERKILLVFVSAKKVYKKNHVN